MGRRRHIKRLMQRAGKWEDIPHITVVWSPEEEAEVRKSMKTGDEVIVLTWDDIENDTEDTITEDN